MFNAVAAALHLLNNRVFFVVVVFDRFCHLKDSGFVSRRSVKKLHHKRKT